MAGIVVLSTKRRTDWQATIIIECSKIGIFISTTFVRKMLRY